MNIYLVALQPNEKQRLQLEYAYRGLASESDDPEFRWSLTTRKYSLYSYKCKPLRKRSL